MPWKNPRCPKCWGKTKKHATSITKVDTWIFVCKLCGWLFEDWAHVSKRNRLT